jgi:pimeloyl-ACP methyl ester carboxylesterase
VIWHRSDVRLSDGTRIAVFAGGRASSEDAPTLVLVHGLGHWTQAAWDRLAPFFIETHRIVALDLPGFGASDRPDVRYTLGYLTDALAAVVEARCSGRVVLVGHSLGGLIAANYAARFADRVAKLVLIDPAGFLRTPKIVLLVAGSGPVSWLFRSIRPSAGFVNRTLDQSVYDPRSVSEVVREQAVELSRDPLLTRAFARVYSGAMQELIGMNELHRRLASWTGPTVLVWGKQDRYVPISGIAQARSTYPGALELAIDHCGHCPAIEYPALVASAIACETSQA